MVRLGVAAAGGRVAAVYARLQGERYRPVRLLFEDLRERGAPRDQVQRRILKPRLLALV